MRGAWIAVIAAGCFAPTPPVGLACGTGGACPSGQTCSAGNTCEPAGGGGDAPLADAAIVDASGATDASADASAASLDVHVSVGVLRVLQDSSELELAGSALVVALADDTIPAITVNTDGSIDFQREATDQAYTIDVPPSVPLGGYEIVAATPSLSFAPPVFGRANPGAVTEETDINVTEESEPSGSGTSLVLTTGVRAFEEEAASGTSSAFTINWEDASVFTGPVPLVESADGDLLWVVHYATTSGPDQAYVDAAASKAAHMQNGGSLSLSPTLTPTTTDCVKVSAPIAADTQRLATATGSAAVATSLSIDSQPASVAGAAGGYAFGLSFSPPDDATYRYSLPLPDETPIVETSLVVSLTRKGANTSTSPAAVLESFEPVATIAACGASVGVTLAVAAAPPIATSVSWNGTPITADMQMVSASTSSASGVEKIAASFDRALGSDDVIEIEVDELMAAGIVGIVRQLSTTPQFSLPSSLFTTGGTYMITVTTLSGYPNAATGDWTTRASAVGEATFPSHTFTLQP